MNDTTSNTSGEQVVEQKAVVKKARVAKPAPTFRVVDLCREFKIDPKIARAKLRRVRASLRVNPDDPHTFPAKRRDEILKIIRAK